jgi:hypothetical protein
MSNTISKRNYLREKFENFKRFIESKTPPDFEPNEEIERFKSMTEEDVITFAVSHLLPYKNNIDYPTKSLCEMFKLDFNDKNVSLMIANYLELFISLIS